MKLFESKQVFSTPKRECLLERIIHVSTKLHDSVFDFFVGSGTTAAVADKMGRQYIGVEQMDYIETILVARLQKVIGKEVRKRGTLFEELEYVAGGGICKAVKRRGDEDFICCELMKYNQAFRKRIQAAKSSVGPLQIWHDKAEGSFLQWYVNPKMPEEAARDFEAISREENGLKKQKRLLAELLDKNQLYINLSEIDDAQFKISDEDKESNQKFYGE